MCLDSNLSKKVKKRIRDLAKKRGYIRVYKSCFENGTVRKTGMWHGEKYRKGLCKADGYSDEGWYAFLNKKAAQRYSGSYEPIKICYAKHSWIKKLGKIRHHGPAAIFAHLAFPDWDKGDMTIREFRAICRKDKP